MGHKKSLKRNLLIALLAGSAALYTMPIYAATSVIANNALPTGGEVIAGKFQGSPDSWASGLEMNIHQNSVNGVIKWDSFNVGGSATVNFNGPQGGYNTLNYVNSGAASQIYGTINGQGGNIYVVNPAGVQIGNSAQINVGSLYVSNKQIDVEPYRGQIEPNINAVMGSGNFTNAELMSLGNINATNVTFEGNGRIVIDSERIKDGNGAEKLDASNILVKTKTADNGIVENVVIGYEAYDKDKGYEGANQGGEGNEIATVITQNGNQIFTKADGYMWVEDVEQLQAINTNLNGNYALRNSIDATSTEQNGFTSIGINKDTGNVDNNGDGFTGKFDGIEYNIFGLNIDGSNNNAGLFGVTNDATINNVTLVGGSISGGENVGAVVGSANNTTISNVVNSAAVTGGTNVGGIVGSATGTTVENAINTGAVSGSAENVGGLIGSMTGTITNGESDSKLIGNSYNLGNVGGVDENGNNTIYASNVGGLVGHAVNSTIGDGTNLVYNRLDVTGLYNVGGIVGNMEGSTVQNAENSATVTATGHYTGEYTYHTANVAGGSETKNVYIANVGGIAGTSSANSEIENVTNSGDVSSGKDNDTQTFSDRTSSTYEFYTAGNVGGIVGSAVDTNIKNATNQENDVRGAHNVGGVAGYFGGSGTVSGGINNGGDIMATGARNNTGFVTETVRPVSGNENFIIGNIGGIVGYLDGDNVKVTGSANRGTVHSQDIDDPEHVLYTSQAANVGGVVGKIDTNENNVNLLTDFRDGNYENASVSNSYNTGDVRGYTGVGGVIGMMYNGSVAGSYNTGTVNTTRQVDRTGGSNIDPLNMGGVVGDTTEETDANAIIYDVYNKGQIGDETYNFYARHVGGVVGRLSGTLEKAYNNGDIYNNDTTVGGVVGWWYKGEIKNVFNTGNITVRAATELQVGGIVGASGAEANSLTNAYNLGTIRGYQESNNAIYVGGIIGRARGGSLNITNVYTMGNLYAATGTYNDNGGSYTSTDRGLGAIYGYNGNLDTTRPHLEGANYITPASDDFVNLETLAESQDINVIDYGERYNGTKYIFRNDGILLTPDKTTGNVENATDDNWRIYGGETTPILNAFLPNVEKYFGDTTKNNMAGIDSIQYGTAYDPLLTIINANKDLTYDWGELGISGAASLVVNNAGLTLNNVDTSAGTGYYAGLLYSQGDLTLNAQQGENVSGDIGFGSEAKLYGSSVKINADGTVTIYGSVTATGEQENSTGNITINAGDVDVYGTLTTGQDTSIAGIANSGSGFDEKETNFDKLSNPNEAMVHISDRFAHETNVNEQATADIVITAGTKLDADGTVVNDENGNPVIIGNGNVNLYYGNKENGITTTGGNLTVNATGDVYVDSDLDIGGDLTLKGTGENSEVVLDLTNIGQVQEKNDNTDEDNSTQYLHEFLTHFANTGNIELTSSSGDAKLAVDMWDEAANNNQGAYNLNKFDYNNDTFVSKLNKLNLTVNSNNEKGDASGVTYIWVSSAEQLQGIQDYYTAHKDDVGGTNALTYNYALKGDINASDLEGYTAIGGDDGEFTGTFDGRGNRIIGLTVSGDNAGIFSTVGKGGVVKDVNIYSGTFTGSSNAGAVAGVNKGRIEGIVTFGNTVTSNGKAGGIAGFNDSGSFSEDETTGSTNDGVLTNGIYDVESTGSVIAGSSTAVAGGLVGTNNGGLANSFSDSAVTVATGVILDKDTTALGGVVGINNGNVQYVDSLGVTNGGDSDSSNIGGVIGINKGNLYSAYNESIVSGNSNVGGIVGVNEAGKTVTNIVNATSVSGVDKSDSSDDASKNVGGLVGSNSGSVTNGRNNGTITGTNYVGGMVGSNAQGATLTNLVNDSSAAITGERYVGGIAGSNAGTITTGNEETDETVNLINRGTITGQQYVGGVAGSNSGTITNANNDVELNVKDSTATGDDAAKYFGGIAGVNTGTIKKATNTANVNADGASYVGGIVGQNNGKLEDMAGNSGNVTGKDFVGGVVGENNGNGNNHDPLDKVIASNTGTVIATNGGAGGIFAVNNAGVINSELTNNGVVIGNGTTGTGGIFGVNKGDISKTSLINKIDGQVIGISNVGGLIGVNSGTITGGRNEVQEVDDTGKVTAEKDSYYKYQIYNNGVINVGTWNDADNELTFGGKGTNIGGLIGSNIKETINGVEQTGSLTAGYNTGAINASGSRNVGGIAGSNAGTIDQVFNTVMTENGQNQTITGGTNVGGLVGYNEAYGKITNAYNTSNVVATNQDGIVGGLVGNNQAYGEITNAYNTSTVTATGVSGNLVGTNSGTVKYVYGVTDKLIGNGVDAVSGYVIDGSDKWLQEGTYDGFTFGANGWKIYDGSTLPMLSVFLTKVTVVDQHLVDQYFSAKHYGEFHQITADDIKALIAIGAISAPDGFGAFNKNNGLIQGVADDAMANSGNWLYSQQILGSNINGLFNPNNLGYDISLVYSPFELDNDPSSHWNYLFNDAPFDRNKDFRERKAEVNFVDGGMEI